MSDDDSSNDVPGMVGGEGDTGFAGPPPRLLEHRQRSVNAIFERAGRKIKIWREVDLGFDDEYGKEEEVATLVGEELAILSNPGTGQGGARPDRVEERFGERIYWEPNIMLQGDSVVQEKDVIEFGIPRFPENQGGGRQLWELETFVPYETHIEGQLQRFVEQG